MSHWLVIMSKWKYILYISTYSSWFTFLLIRHIIIYLGAGMKLVILCVRFSYSFPALPCQLDLLTFLHLSLK